MPNIASTADAALRNAMALTMLLPADRRAGAAKIVSQLFDYLTVEEIDSMEDADQRRTELGGDELTALVEEFHDTYTL